MSLTIAVSVSKLESTLAPYTRVCSTLRPQFLQYQIEFSLALYNQVSGSTVHFNNPNIAYRYIIGPASVQ